MTFFTKELNLVCLECSKQTMFIFKQNKIEYCEDHLYMMDKDAFNWKAKRFFNNKIRLKEYYKSRDNINDVSDVDGISLLKVDSTLFKDERRLLNLIDMIEEYFDIELNYSNLKYHIHLYKICVSKNIKHIPTCCGIPYKMNVRKDKLIKDCECNNLDNIKRKQTVKRTVDEYINKDPDSLISKTVDILPVLDKNKFSDLQINIRKYIIKNKLTMIPLCNYCSEQAGFHGKFLPTCGSKNCVTKSRSCSRLSSTKIIDSTRNKVNDCINDNFEIIEYADRCIRETTYKLKCKKCNSVFDKNLGCGKYKLLKCPVCFPNIRKRSAAELEILNFVQGQSSNRIIISPLELDIVKDNFAIEYNGMYWHSDKYKDKFYHQLKTESCESKGITLFHIFEHEWLDENVKEIWKSILNIKMRKYNKIDIDDCQILFTDASTIQKFCTINHLEGYIESEINIGVYYNGDLLQSLSLTSADYSLSGDNLIITRFCTKKNIVINGLSQMLYLLENIKNIKSIKYISNRRYEYCSSFKDISFIPIYTEPNLLYIRPDLISKKSDHTIFDSGNIIWTKTY